jgi:uncharacterized protein (DUF1330 family)
MAAYIVLNIQVTDAVRFQEYARAAGGTVAQFGGRYLARGGKAEALEGAADPRRVVILEFPSYDRAKTWWDSVEYSGPKQMRRLAAVSDTLIVEGV